MKNIEFSLNNEDFQKGQGFLADQVKILFRKENPLLYELIGESSEAFLEPLLFAYFGNELSIIPIEQIVYGYIPKEKRPSKIKIYANQNGIIEIPHIGYIKTNKKEKTLFLERIKDTEGFIISYLGKSVNFQLISDIYIPGTKIALSQYENELLNPLFVNEYGVVKPNFPFITENKVKKIAKAFSLIKVIVPQYYAVMEEATKRIYLYSGDDPYSFASVKAHGIAFIRTGNEGEELFFCEDLIHQCGHIIFSAIAAKRSYFLLDNDTFMRDLTGANINDMRTIFIGLHGLFTEGWMSLFFNSCFYSNYFSSKQLQELIGRLALIFTRFGIDLRFFYQLDIFNESGRILIDELFQLYLHIFNDLGKMLGLFQITNQPYCFDKKIFFSSNKENLTNANFRRLVSVL